jgi:hypothetical protein
MASQDAVDVFESDLTMTAGQLAMAFAYVQRRDGKPDRKKVYRLVRAGILPGPIDARLDVIDWRWSRAVIERYAAGEWKTSAS